MTPSHAGNGWVRTEIQRCLSWLFPCTSPCVLYPLGINLLSPKDVVMLICLHWVQAWVGADSVLQQPWDSSLGAAGLLCGLLPSALISLCSFVVVQLFLHSLTDKHYRDVLCWVQLRTNLCKLLYLHNAAQGCVNAWARVSAALEICAPVHLLRPVKCTFSEMESLRTLICFAGCKLWYLSVSEMVHKIHLCVVCNSIKLWCIKMNFLLHVHAIYAFFFPLGPSSVE